MVLNLAHKEDVCHGLLFRALPAPKASLLLERRGPQHCPGTACTFNHRPLSGRRGQRLWPVTTHQDLTCRWGRGDSARTSHTSGCCWDDVCISPQSRQHPRLTWWPRGRREQHRSPAGSLHWGDGDTAHRLRPKTTSWTVVGRRERLEGNTHTPTPVVVDRTKQSARGNITPRARGLRWGDGDDTHSQHPYTTARPAALRSGRRRDGSRQGSWQRRGRWHVCQGAGH